MPNRSQRKPQQQNAKRKSKAKQKKRTTNHTTMRVVKQPMAISCVTRNSAPAITGGKHGIRVRHREFVFTPVLGVNFGWATYHYSIQPGLISSFPWLAGLANNFERYKIHNLRYVYVPICSTATAASLTMVVDYDPRDHTNGGDSLNRALLMQNETAVSTPAWKGHTMSCNVNALMGGMTSKFVRAFSVDPIHATSIRSSDCGEIILGLYRPVESTGTEITFGDIWVEYDVELITPQPNLVTPVSSFTFAPIGAYANVYQTTPTQTESGYTNAKLEGPTIGAWSWISSGQDNITTTWNLQDLIPNSYYWVDFAINEIGAGVADALTLTAIANVAQINNPMNKLSTTAGGVVALRMLFKALDAVATFATGVNGTGAAGASHISGSSFKVTPVYDQQSPFVNFS